MIPTRGIDRLSRWGRAFGPPPSRWRCDMGQPGDSEIKEKTEAARREDHQQATQDLSQQGAARVGVAEYSPNEEDSGEIETFPAESVFIPNDLVGQAQKETTEDR
jgi:hypothetical protein